MHVWLARNGPCRETLIGQRASLKEEDSGAAWRPLLPNTTKPVPVSSKKILSEQGEGISFPFIILGFTFYFVFLQSTETS